ncbi:uncharacterized protein LOC143845994 isoform X2 [Tasmannia lanceolata]|uniref:uncharacterized protein LOC143845994 isoform X2 n=1 Tax=Tasmannia lanceolata TaxID=3420 RepID=UPI0040629500
MATEEYRSPQIPKQGRKDSILSPGFRSVAAMAGWDEEALLLATLIVEDTPERESKHKKRIKTPPTNSRRPLQNTPASIPSRVIDLDDEETVKEEGAMEKKKATEIVEIKEKKPEDTEGIISCSLPALPCIDRLREELSCAICLEICFEPSTTPCGHSFCKKCLKSAADKCGKRCPKCRQLISNGRSCTVNTVLWNTIQLLFPDEVKARNVAVTNSHETKHKSKKSCGNIVESSTPNTRFRGIDRSLRRRRGAPSQEEDAALAFRLQREEFMDAFRRNPDQERNSVHSARANLRAMASRAINLRLRSWPT